MANLGLRGNAFFPTLAPNSIAAVFNTFDSPSGPFGARGARNCLFPTAATYLHRITTSQPPFPHASSLCRLQRLGPVWAVPACGTPDAVLVNIDLDKDDKQLSILNKPDAASLQVLEQDEYLRSSCFLRSAPLVSSLLVGKLDNTTYATILGQLGHVSDSYPSCVVRTVAFEVQAGLQQHTFLSEALCTPAFNISKPTLHQTSRNKYNLFLDSFPTSAVQEFDYILLAKKIIENPDFPVVAPWHQEFATLRPWYDVALGLSEDHDGDIFTHEVFLKKVFLDFNKRMEAPNEHRLRMFRRNAINDARKMMQAEAAAAVLGEPHRLLQVKIEDLISEVAKTDEQLKALRMIELKSLDIVKVLDSSDADVAVLLRAEMEKTLSNNKYVVNADEICICDLFSQYSEDESEHHFNDADARESLFSKRKRNAVEKWLFSFEDSTFYHVDLFIDDRNYCGPLEPVGEADDMIETVTLQTWPHGGEWEFYSCSFEFPRHPAGMIVLGLGHLPDQKYSEGHFTNMISAASFSDASSKSSSFQEESNDAVNPESSHTSLEEEASKGAVNKN